MCWTSRASACTSAITTGSSPRCGGCATWGIPSSSWSTTRTRSARRISSSISAPAPACAAGEIIAQGSVAEVLENPASLTAQYLIRQARASRSRNAGSPPASGSRSRGATENNLAEVDAAFPLGCFTCVTGVSGSGKSTLVDDILRRALFRHFYRAKDRPGAYKAIHGLDFIDKAIVIDQSPIGRTPRSNPGDLHGRVWAHPPALCQSARLAGARLRVRAVFLQRERGAAASIARAKG